ncbi:hypothetical protein RJ640_006006, partial [Escallonia rubra]
KKLSIGEEMGRAPCCDKANVKKGPWSPEEDAKLKSYIDEHGTGGNWIALPQKIGLKRCGKSCRLRWLNYLRPNIKHGGFSEEEDNIICSLYISIGSRWSIIAAQLPGRTDNDIKNYWNTRLKKKLLGKQRKEQQAARRGISQKQEMMKKGRQSSMAPNVNDLNQYWPQPPVHPPIPYSNQEPRFNDHASIRKLLIKLGGRFADDSDDQPIINCTPSFQFPLDTSSLQPAYEQPTDALINTTAQVTNAPYSLDHGASIPILSGGHSSFPEETLEELVYNNPHRLEGLEFLYGNDIVNVNRGASTSTTTCGGSIDWGEMSSLVYAPVSNSNNGTFQQGALHESVSNSNNETFQQVTLHECGFNELRYSGSQ